MYIFSRIRHSTGPSFVKSEQIAESTTILCRSSNFLSISTFYVFLFLFLYRARYLITFMRLVHRIIIKKGSNLVIRCWRSPLTSSAITSPFVFRKRKSKSFKSWLKTFYCSFSTLMVVRNIAPVCIHSVAQHDNGDCSTRVLMWSWHRPTWPGLYTFIDFPRFLFFWCARIFQYPAALPSYKNSCTKRIKLSSLP